MNTKVILTAVGGLVVGAILTGIIGFYSLPGMMMMEDESRYDFETTVQIFEEKTLEAGWSVVVTHDMQEILQGHGHDVIGVKIFELCSSRYSAEILKLDDERIVTPMMPCRIAIYEKSDGKTYVARMDSQLMAKPFGGVINDVMQKAAAEMEAVVAQVIR
ncbi:MAG: DUF302 domain-containing protein [Bacteroidetes bacterium]|nr:DUF302 domain-containing protein [Bacteroidota bacterium]MCH8525193.1 DUF302 domain-containing protein [Balneolales bacterium]